MSIKYKFFLLLPFICFLSGCDKENTYDYLIEHPLKLNQEFTDCQIDATKSPARNEYCQMVAKAANTVSDIIEQEQQDSLQFGQHLLEKEMACAKSKEDLRQAQQTLDVLKQKNAAAADIATAEQNLNALNQQYTKQHDEIKQILAVLGLNRPE